MALTYVLRLDDPLADLNSAGGKGASLARLARAGLPVPDGFHVTTAAYRQFVAVNQLQPRLLAALEPVDAAQPASLEAAARVIQAWFQAARLPADIAAAIGAGCAALGAAAVAVRSSATAEDLPELSFAGQQDTFLNLRGAAAVLDAVQRCWASLWTARAIGYRARHQIDQNAVSLAVVVQRLVPAEAAGVLFTAHPITGARDQAMLTAAWGLGEAIVGGLVTPDTLIVEKAAGRVLTRETADKQVLTVRLADGTAEQPAPADRRRAPVLSDAQAVELTRLGVRIEQLYGLPMDIEWALADGHFAILQARPITALPAAEQPPAATELPAAWPVPNPKAWYARGSLGEHLPNPASPLFSTLGLRIAAAETRRLMKSLTGTDLDASVIAVNGYVYMGYRFRLGELIGAVGPLLKVVGPLLRESTARWETARARLAEAARWWAAQPLETLTAAELLTGVQAVFGEAARYYTVIQSGVLGMAGLSEITFASACTLLFKRRGDPAPTTFLFGFDTAPILAEKALFDLAQAGRACLALTQHLRQTPAEQLARELAAAAPPADVPAEAWRPWQAQFQAHLRRYGQIAYDFDFANPLPAEAPAALLEAVKTYLAGQGQDPYQRQQAAAERREAATRAVTARLRWPRLGWFQSLLRWAQATVPIREDSLADMSLGHAQIRRLLHELGRRCAAGGAISQADDIYWLVEQEVTELVAGLERGAALPDFSRHVPTRRAAWHAALKLTPPAVLPQRSRLAKLVPWSEQRQKDKAALKGQGTSPGRVTAPACVLCGPDDFSKMKPGAVLVAVTTTPAWTPLFVMAAAVVTDIGGPLSHSSIVAREYGIPAVMATGVATRRIRDGQLIAVDGGTGIVTLSE